MNENLNVLNEVHKGLVMGMESLSVISSKVGDQQFKQILDDQYEQYGYILDRVNNKFQEYGKQADDTSPAQKVMGWTGIQMGTMTDKSNSKISDMLIRGTTMGIIEGRKLLNQNLQLDQDVEQILLKYPHQLFVQLLLYLFLLSVMNLCHCLF